MNPSPSILAETITAPPPTTRRPSNYVLENNKPNKTTPPPLLPRIQSSEVSFSSLSLQSPTTPTHKYAHTKSPTEHHPYFSVSQLAAIRLLCSAVEINDWSFLSLEKYAACYSAQGAYDLEMSTLGLSIDLAANNPRTRNFTRLVAHLLSLLKELQSNQHETIPIQTFNALFLTNALTKQFACNLTNQELIHQFEDSNSLQGEQLVEALLYVLINMDPCFSYSTYEFYTEILNTMIILCSTQLRHSKASQTNNYFLHVLMHKFANRAETVVARLLENLISQKTAPPQSSSVMYTAYNYFFSGRTNVLSDTDSIPVADRSLLLLLLLGTQPLENDSKWMKAYRFALATLSDHNMVSNDIDEPDRKMHLISFKDLFEIFSTSLHIEERMLLFYLILKENETFRVYVLSRTDPETIYMPILRLIYESMEGKTNYSQVYVLFVILLILSQDDVNNEAVHKVVVSNITWFIERPLLKSVSLGGLVILILIRTLQLNLSHHKDVFIHTNALAILSNMSNRIYDMHAYVAQRFISFFEVLARRYIKSTESLTIDISVYEDILVLLLETINSALSYCLKHNAQLVYALLQKREIFTPFESHPRLADLVHNLEQVIQYFNTRVSEANLKAPSSNEVLRLVEQAARTWSNQKLILLPVLKFSYEEEQNSFEFFIPYIWALIHRKSFIYWSEEKCHVLDNYRAINEENA
ncbi:Dymeclin [Gilbertella persicaria]|uniref:Dymeclin n=1 Tax=Rhizopus stolonifer TaxID=4846 RepID=A0A367KV57_RHIST|nr:Dymeclin [Gilbertella persicaria]KAI8071187.1 Dymeclin [Gilbertella persicaria]RCI06037.1 hypothetical protein CU098_013426 [Rhizopus stolonifer]